MNSVVPKTGEGLKYNGRITLLILLSCFMTATGGFVFGYDLGVSGGVTSMSAFLKKFFPDVYNEIIADTHVSNYCKFNSQKLTLFTSSLYLAGLFASFLGLQVTRVFGRRPSILVGGVVFLAGSALGSSASNLYMLIFSRVLLGVGLGFTNQSVPLYISEMTLPQHRGKMSGGFGLGAVIGVLAANLTNYVTVKIRGGWGWRVSLAMPAVPAAVLTLCVLLLPETPNNLMLKSNNHQKAKRVLERIRGTTDVQVEFDDLIKASSNLGPTGFQYMKILQRKYRPQLVMAFAMPFFQHMTGIDVISFYSPVLFRTIGRGESDSLLLTVFLRIIASAFIVASMFMVDKSGRKKLFMVGGTLMFPALTVLGAVFAAKFGDHGALPKEYAYTVLGLICIYITGFSLSWAPLSTLIPGEIYPLEVRSTLQSVSIAMHFLLSFAVGQVFLAMLCHMKSGVFFFFGGWMVVMIAFVFFFLPETKNVPIEQMEQVWKLHWFWKRFYEVDEENM